MTKVIGPDLNVQQFLNEVQCCQTLAQTVKVTLKQEIRQKGERKERRESKDEGNGKRKSLQWSAGKIIDEEVPRIMLSPGHPFKSSKWLPNIFTVVNIEFHQIAYKLFPHTVRFV